MCLFHNSSMLPSRNVHVSQIVGKFPSVSVLSSRSADKEPARFHSFGNFQELCINTSVSVDQVLCYNKYTVRYNRLLNNLSCGYISCWCFVRCSYFVNISLWNFRLDCLFSIIQMCSQTQTKSQRCVSISYVWHHWTPWDLEWRDNTLSVCSCRQYNIQFHSVCIV